MEAADKVRCKNRKRRMFPIACEICIFAYVGILERCCCAHYAQNKMYELVIYVCDAYNFKLLLHFTYKFLKCVLASFLVAYQQFLFSNFSQE